MKGVYGKKGVYWKKFMANMSTDDYKFLLKEAYGKHVYWWFLRQTYLGVHSAPWQCLGILKTNHSV